MTARRRPPTAVARVRTRPRLAGHPVLALASSGVLAAAGLALLAHGRLLLHECVTAGALGPLGVHLAVLRDAADCPEGAFGFGPVTSGAVLLLSVVLPMLALHVALTVCGLGLTAAVVRVARGVAALLERVLTALPAPPRPVPVVGRTAVVAPVPGPRRRVAAAPLGVRGPPCGA